MSTTAPSLSDLDAFCARSLAAWNDHDPAAMADLVTEDVVWEDPALPGVAHGPAAVQDFMREAWVAFEGVGLWEMRDGRIARCRAYYDFNALAVQLGLAPAPGGRMEKAMAALQRLGAKATARRRTR